MTAASTDMPPPLHHEMIIEALGRLLRAEQHELDGAVAHVLGEVGERLKADRISVLLKDDAGWHCSHEWCAQAVASVADALQALPLDTAEYTPAALLDGKDILLDDVATLPESPLRALLISLGLRRLAAVPMARQGRPAGVISLGWQGAAQPLIADDIARLRPLADGLYACISRHRTEAALDRARTAQGAAVERMRATLAAMEDLVIELDADGRCVDIHCMRPELLAAPPERVIGARPVETLPPEIAALNRAVMAEAREKGISKPVEYWLKTGGKRRRFRLRAVRRVVSGGKSGFVLRIADITDQHEQSELNDLLGAVTRNMTNFAQILDESLRIRWVNPAFEECVGVPLASLIGRPIRDFTGPKTSRAALEAVERAVAARAPARVTGHRLDRNNKDIWFDVSLQPWHDRAGRFRGFLSVETDITEQKRHEGALAEMARRAEAAHAHLTGAIEALDDGFVLFDADDRLVLCNSRYRQINAAMADIIRPGVTMQAIIETGTRRGLYRHEPGRAEAKQRALRDNIVSDSFEEELLYADGRVIRAFGTRLPDGGHVGLRTDITALRRAEQRLADIITGARIATWDLDLITDIEEVNDFWFQMLGYQRGDLPARSQQKWALLAHPDDNARVDAELARVIAGNSDRLEVEARLRHQEGHWVHVLSRGHVTERDGNGRALRMSGIDIDLTERRRAEERLRAILEGTSIASWEFDTSIPGASIDENYAAMLGYRLDELTPFSIERFLSLCHPGDAERMMATTRAAGQRGDETLSNEIRLRHKRGHWVWVMCKTRVHRWAADGLAEAASGINIDITEAREREAALA